MKFVLKITQLIKIINQVLILSILFSFNFSY